MSDQFHLFSKAVHAQFTEMIKGELFVVDIDGDTLYEAYQAAFPAGTNEIFRTRREHECSCCENFIRNIGNVVSIRDGKLVTVWDVTVLALPVPYGQVASTLAAAVRAGTIKSVFRSEMPSYGAEKTAEPANEKNGGCQIIWNHFHGKVAKAHYAGKEAAARIGEAAALAQVLGRGLREIRPDDVQTVLELIDANALYRGAEKRHVVQGFQHLQGDFLLTETEQEDLFIWSNISHPAARTRNDVIGTLLTDLAEGKPLELAVKSYEDKVSGTNYKRPTALITPRMVEDAMRTVQELGLEPALQRRFARIDDVSVNDIRFVDNAVRGRMKGGLSDLLMAEAKKNVTVDAGAAQDIGVDDFLATVVPKAKSMSVLLKNRHLPNFVSLTAPVHADAPPLFKWDNGFAWSYDGNVTDSIKDRVKAAGGVTDAVMRVSLAWFNFDDLDLHAIEPGGHEICFHQYRKGRTPAFSPNGGQLDVDMNAGGGSTRNAVENIIWQKVPGDGEYRVVVHNYSKRETTDNGYTLEVEFGGVVRQFSCPVSPRNNGQDLALVITMKGGRIAQIQCGVGIEAGDKAQEKWGVHTEQFVKVDTLMLSPNHWGEQAVGAKHTIFILDGCKNPAPTRGVYNEFLRSDLDKHRKVFELLGAKTMCQPAADQLSGVGFTAARGDEVVVQVDGGRQYNVKF
jgi:hypothetical protein